MREVHGSNALKFNSRISDLLFSIGNPGSLRVHILNESVPFGLDLPIRPFDSQYSDLPFPKIYNYIQNLIFLSITYSNLCNKYIFHEMVPKYGCPKFVYLQKVA